jgi:hypothetical protein
MPTRLRQLLMISGFAGIALMGILGVWLGLLMNSAGPVMPESVGAGTQPEAADLRRADLKSDWKEEENPHAGEFGTWSFTQNGKALKWDENWDGLPGEGIRGWGPGVSPETDYLFVCRALNKSHPEALGFVEVLDVLMHTATAGREPGKILWTSSWTGKVAVSGALWPTRFLGRTNVWRLRHITRDGAKQLAAGELPEDGTVTRDRPNAFKLPELSIQEGEVLELEVDRSANTTPWGDFAAIMLTITEASPSTPAAATTPTTTTPAEIVSHSIGKSETPLIGFLTTVIALLGLGTVVLGVTVMVLWKRLHAKPAGTSPETGDTQRDGILRIRDRA